MKTKDLDDIQFIEQVDQARMRDIIAGLPANAQKAYQLGKDFSVPIKGSGLKNIVFGGMGGSAIGAEVIGSYLREEIKLPVSVNRDYSLPNFVNQESLVILASYSGNTEETLSIYEQAKKKQARIFILTSGGELAEKAKKDNYPLLVIPGGLPPRGALAFMSFPILALLAKSGFIADKQPEAEEAISVLEGLRKDSLGPEVPKQRNLAKQLAQDLLDKFCVIYAANERLGSIVTRWRGQLAENSKVLASSHTLPEMNHNEIVGWQHPHGLLENFQAIFLRDKQDHPQVKKRIEICKDILEKQGFKVKQVYSQGEGLLARIFSLIYIGDYLSLYLAILNNEDPTPVKRIDYLKKRLKEI